MGEQEQRPGEAADGRVARAEQAGVRIAVQQLREIAEHHRTEGRLLWSDCADLAADVIDEFRDQLAATPVPVDGGAEDGRAHTFNEHGTPWCPVEHVPVFVDDDGSCSACGALIGPAPSAAPEAPACGDPEHRHGVKPCEFYAPAPAPLEEDGRRPVFDIEAATRARMKHYGYTDAQIDACDDQGNGDAIAGNHLDEAAECAAWYESYLAAAGPAPAPLEEDGRRRIEVDAELFDALAVAVAERGSEADPRVVTAALALAISARPAPATPPLMLDWLVVRGIDGDVDDTHPHSLRVDLGVLGRSRREWVTNLTEDEADRLDALAPATPVEGAGVIQELTDLRDAIEAKRREAKDSAWIARYVDGWLTGRIGLAEARLAAAAPVVQERDERVELVLAMANELGSAYRGDWANFDGRSLRLQLDELRLVASGEWTAVGYRASNSLCPLGQGHWTEYCDAECEADTDPLAAGTGEAGQG